MKFIDEASNRGVRAAVLSNAIRHEARAIIKELDPTMRYEDFAKSYISVIALLEQYPTGMMANKPKEPAK